jgi:hypothetical protein
VPTGRFWEGVTVEGVTGIRWLLYPGSVGLNLQGRAAIATVVVVFCCFIYIY